MAARRSRTGTRSVQEGTPASRSSAAAHVTLITHSASVSPSPEEPEEAIAGCQDEAALIHLIKQQGYIAIQGSQCQPVSDVKSRAEQALSLGVT